MGSIRFKKRQDLVSIEAPQTTREVLLSQSAVLRSMVRDLDVLHASALVLGDSGTTPADVRGFLKRSSTTFGIAADQIDSLAENARFVPYGQPAWRFILHMAIAMALAFAALMGLAIGLAWAFDEPPRGAVHADQEWMAMHEQRLDASRSAEEGN